MRDRDDFRDTDDFADTRRDPFADRGRRRDEGSRGAGFSRIADDLGRLMTDAVGVAEGVRREVDGVLKSQAERLMRDMDVVTREEFEVVRDMAIRARDENEKLEQRLAALEARLSAKG
jgi:BMFP domain-containing protein YqiC